MSEHAPEIEADPTGRQGELNRIHLFVDNSNMDITMKQRAAKSNVRWEGFDWAKLPDWLTEQAAAVCRMPTYTYTGTHVYVSYSPDSKGQADTGLRKWMDWLDLQPGVHVVRKARQPKDPQTCKACRHRFSTCPNCGAQQRAQVEKGIDTAMVTDMMRLAWDGSYDVAVLVTSDSDFAPAVETLEGRGLRVVQAGFPGTGAYLKRTCWASFDMFGGRSAFERPPRRGR